MGNPSIHIGMPKRICIDIKELVLTDNISIDLKLYQLEKGLNISVTFESNFCMVVTFRLSSF